MWCHVIKTVKKKMLRELERPEFQSSSYLVGTLYQVMELHFLPLALPGYWLISDSCWGFHCTIRYTVDTDGSLWLNWEPEVHTVFTRSQTWFPVEIVSIQSGVAVSWGTVIISHHGPGLPGSAPLKDRPRHGWHEHASQHVPCTRKSAVTCERQTGGWKVERSNARYEFTYERVGP